MPNDIVTPNTDLRPTVDLNKFRFWCQKVLPLVYDDSISYYEVLGKMVVYLNQVIDNVNADTENVLTLKQAFDELKAYVDELVDYDISDLEEKLAQAIHAAELATEAGVLAQGYAEAANTQREYAQTAAENAAASATNAASSATNAINAETNARGYASDANSSALNAANSAVTASAMAQTSTDNAKISEGYAVGKQNGADVSSSSPYYHNNSKYYSEQANASSESAETEALKAEGLATGQQNGVDVDSSSPYYHKNAKYYAEQAGQGAGAFPLSELPDTNIVNPENGQILAYDATSEKWVNSDDVQGVTSLDALTDTNLINPATGQVLMYDATTEKWVNSDENEVAVSSSAPSNPATKIWINEAEGSSVSLATTPDLMGLRNEVATIVNNINASLLGKENLPTVITRTDPSQITLADNTEYYLTNVNNVLFAFPSDNFECWIYMKTDSNFSGIVFPDNVAYIGDEPDIGAMEKWEISVKNGVVIAGKVE